MIHGCKNLKKRCSRRLWPSSPPAWSCSSRFPGAGNAEEDADIDVVIVSEAFAGIPFVKRMPAVLKNIGFEKHIDAICYLPDEFERMKSIPPC